MGTECLGEKQQTTEQLSIFPLPPFFEIFYIEISKGVWGL